jgi:asparagine synthase (glutamine-hydrolysing)
MEGMWAFAIHDERDGSLFLCRDRFGEKPLYLYRDDTGVYFGSEVKLLSILAGTHFTPNVEMLYRYMVNGYKSLYKTPAAFFLGVEEVPRATWLRIDSRGHEERKSYWIPEFRQDDAMTYEEAVSGAKDRLLRSMEIRLRSDVPLAFCMSGGVDSNALISIAKRVFDYDVHGFTIMNTDSRYEERDLVEASVKELGIKHTSIPVSTDDFLNRLRSLIRQHDAPIYTITYYAHWLLMDAISRHGYRVSLSGTAADELFSGYFDHHLAYLAAVKNQPDLHAQSRSNWQKHIQPVVRNPYLRNPDLFIDDPAFRDHIFLNAEDFAACLHKPWNESFSETVYTDDLLRNRMLNEMFHEAVPPILHEDDLNSMYCSVENRSPYLDRPLFEFCNRIPTHHLIQDGAAKAVLRSAMRGIVPEPVLQSRRKVGFNAPIFSFLDKNDPSVRERLLSPSPIFDHVRKSSIEQLLKKDDLPNSESKFLFYFLNSRLFLEEFGT